MILTFRVSLGSVEVALIQLARFFFINLNIFERKLLVIFFAVFLSVSDSYTELLKGGSVMFCFFEELYHSVAR